MRGGGWYKKREVAAPEKPPVPPLEAVEIHGPSKAKVGQTVVYKAAAKPTESAEVLGFLWEVRDEKGKVIVLGEGVDFWFIPDEPGIYSITLRAVGPAQQPLKEAALTLEVTPVKVTEAEDKETSLPSEKREPSDTSSSPQGNTLGSKTEGVVADGFVAVNLSIPPSFSFNLIAAGDINGDGKADLVLGSTNLTTVTLFQGLGNGQFHEVGSLSLGLRPEELVVADLNSNMYADILAVNWSLNRAVLLLANKDFQFSSPRLIWPPNGAWDVFAHQLDETPGSELVWITKEGVIVWSFTIFGSVLEWAHPPRELSFVMMTAPPYVRTDFDNDGALELVFYSNNPGEIECLDTTNTPIVLAVTPAGMSLLDLAVTDLEGDGIKDLLALSSEDTVYIWKLGEEK